MRVHSLLSPVIPRRQFRALLAFNFIFLKNDFRQDKVMSFFPCVFHHLLRKRDLVLQKSMLRSFSPGISKILMLSIFGTTVLPWYRQCSLLPEHQCSPRSPGVGPDSTVRNKGRIKMQRQPHSTLNLGLQRRTVGANTKRRLLLQQETNSLTLWSWLAAQLVGSQLLTL